MRLIQFLNSQEQPQVGRVNEAGTRVAILGGVQSVYEIAQACFKRGIGLDEWAQSAAVVGEESYPELLNSGRMLPPLTHSDPHHCLVSGTGLTHLGSAATRDAMHQKAKAQA